MSQKNGSAPTTKTKIKKKLRKGLIAQRTVAVILITVVLGGIGIAGAFYVYAKGITDDAPILYPDKFIQAESTEVYDVEGNEIYATGLKLRENITYDDLPQVLIDAFVAVEDSRFFEHNGFDIPRFTRAALTNLQDTITAGRIVFGQGGSTFTMQLIKNTYFYYEDPLTGETLLPAGNIGGIPRKIQEIYLSTILDGQSMLSKESILESYLNLVNFGATNILGVQNSSAYYFGKDVSELNLIESAFLAGVINAPSANTPYYSIENAIDRTNQVLYQMHYHGYIDDLEYQLALSVDLENIFVKDDASSAESHAYQAYIDVVISEVKEITGLDPALVPMKIYTAMNPTIQAGIDSFQNREIAALDQGADTHIQVGSAIVRNKTGEIVGIVGGYDYKGQLVLNRATSSFNQPGSTIKPIIDYALAFEYLGWSTSHTLVDEPSIIGGNLIYNYDNRYLGEITLMHAIADSRNITALKTISALRSEIGDAKIVEYLNSLGFSEVTTEFFDAGYGIGGSTFLASPLQLAGAYAAIMNGGNYIQPHTVLRIEFKDGQEPIVPTYLSVPVLSEAAAYLTTRLTKYVVESPYGGTIAPTRRSYTVFGKTGSTDWGVEAPQHGAPVGATKDRLMVTQTSEYSIGTWTGFDVKKAEYEPWFSSTEYYFNLVGKLNSYLLDLIESQYGQGTDIAQPSGVSQITHILGTYPYQSVISGMNSDLITTGLIKSEFNELVSAEAPQLETLTSHSVTQTYQGSTLTFNIALAAYPDESKLTVADSTLIMEYPDGSGRTTSGTRLYDSSWIYGAVRYYSQVRVNGEVIEELVTADRIHTLSIEYNPAYTNVSVCSFYTYELNTDVRSNDVCTTVDLSDITVTVPSFTTFAAFSEWIVAYGINAPIVYWNNNTSLNQFNRIASISPNWTNSNVSLGTLRSTTFTVNVYDYTFNPSNYIGTLFSTFKSRYENYLQITTSGSGNTIAQIRNTDNSAVNSFTFSNNLNRAIVVGLTD